MENKNLFGPIKFISGNVAHVANIATAEEMGDLMNVHVVFIDETRMMFLFAFGKKLVCN